MKREQCFERRHTKRTLSHHEKYLPNLGMTVGRESYYFIFLLLCFKQKRILVS